MLLAFFSGIFNSLQDNFYTYREQALGGALKISQNPQKNTCAKILFLIKMSTLGMSLKQKYSSIASVFLRIFVKFSEQCFTEQPLATISENCLEKRWKFEIGCYVEHLWAAVFNN